MKTFYLKTKTSDEVIKKGDFYSEELAIEYFSKIKQISIIKLLDLFRVTTK
jgi:hypothetical protein